MTGKKPSHLKISSVPYHVPTNDPLQKFTCSDNPNHSTIPQWHYTILFITSSDSARHRSKDICPPISQIVLKNLMKISLIIKECPNEIVLKLTIVLKISKSSWNTAFTCIQSFFSSETCKNLKVKDRSKSTYC